MPGASPSRRRSVPPAGLPSSAASPAGRVAFSPGTAGTTAFPRTGSTTGPTLGAAGARRPAGARPVRGRLDAARARPRQPSRPRPGRRPHLGPSAHDLRRRRARGPRGFADPYCPTGAGGRGGGHGGGVAAREGGTLVVINGPRFSSRAESTWHAAAGGHVVGMTGMPEASIARELALCYTTAAVVTDLDAGFESGEASRTRRSWRPSVRASSGSSPCSPPPSAGFPRTTTVPAGTPWTGSRSRSTCPEAGRVALDVLRRSSSRRAAPWPRGSPRSARWRHDPGGSPPRYAPVQPCSRWCPR